MGVYVNPENESKEDFLFREGKLVSRVVWETIPAGKLPVILMDNGFLLPLELHIQKMNWMLLPDQKTDDQN